MSEANAPAAAAVSVAERPIDLLAAALCKAQAKMRNPPKTKTVRITSKKDGRTFSYAYADLADVMEVVRPCFADHALAILHIMDRVDDRYILRARLLHASGQYLDSIYPVPKEIGTAQDMGSWLTYMRRYSTCNLAFISGETDEDAADIIGVDREPKRETPHLDKAATEGRVKSAYDGRTLKPGESPDAEPKDADKNPDLEPAAAAEPEPKKKSTKKNEDTTYEGIDKALAVKMKEAGIAPAALAAVCKKFIGDTPISKWDSDFISKVTSEVNWPKISAKALEGAK